MSAIRRLVFALRLCWKERSFNTQLAYPGRLYLARHEIAEHLSQQMSDLDTHVILEQDPLMILETLNKSVTCD